MFRRLFVGLLALTCTQCILSAESPKLIKPAKRSLIQDSTILVSYGKSTLIPNGSILFVPDNLKSKITKAPSGTMITWKDFVASNGSWIHKHPVKMKQARGEALVSQEAIARYQKLGKIVVATYGGAPISVAPKALLPPAEEQ